MSSEDKLSLSLGGCYKNFSPNAAECRECLVAHSCKQHSKINKERTGKKQPLKDDIMESFLDAMKQEFEFVGKTEKNTGFMYRFARDGKEAFVWQWKDAEPPRLEGKAKSTTNGEVKTERFSLGVLRKDNMEGFVKTMIGRLDAT